MIYRKYQSYYVWKKMQLKCIHGPKTHPRKTIDLMLFQIKIVEKSGHVRVPVMGTTH